MSHTTMDETQIKELFKQAFVELLEERKDLFRDLVAEVVEEAALARAIREGEGTDTVQKNEVLQALEGTS